MTGTLFLVGTPIGNVGDVSDRARSTLAAVDVVACEDTRRTGRLLSRLGVEAKLVSFYEENERRRVPGLVARLRAGADVALVSDAGMPALSDPGYRLVAACVDEGIPVDVIPGPSAAVAALVISGLPTDRFVFEGFLPRSGRARTDRLAALAGESRTAVLFEAPGRTAATLRDLRDACGDRRVAVARELTKLHQEVVRGRLPDVAEELADRTLRGEVAIVLEGAPDVPPAGGLPQAVAEAERLVAGGARKREAAKEAGRRHGVPSSRVYAALVEPSAKK